MLFRNHYFPAISPHLIKENGKLKNPVEEKAILQKFAQQGYGNISKEKEYLYIKAKDNVYVIHQHEIASGTFGKICFGYNILTGQWIAAKFITEKKYNECEYKGLFRAKKLIENEVFLYKGERIILMELEKGQELLELKLGDWQGRHVVTWPLLLWLEICIELLEGLKKLHDIHIIHCDLKLENILYSLAYGILKIIDFGSSELLDNGIAQKQKLEGTFGYFAPEILEKKENYPYTIKTDIYAMGILLHEILFSERKDTEEELKNPAEPKFIPQTQPPLTKDPILKNHIKSMYALNPDMRPPLPESIHFFREYTGKYRDRNPKEVFLVTTLKQKARYAEYQRLSEAKIKALEPWKAFQQSIAEDANVSFIISMNFFNKKSPVSDQCKIMIESFLLDEDTENAIKYAAHYIEDYPDDPFAKALKKHFKLQPEQNKKTPLALSGRNV